MATVLRRTLVAAASVATLVLISIPLAAPGAALVPGAEGSVEAPGWLLGLFGNGFGLSPGVYLGLLYAAVLVWIALIALADRLDRRVVAAAIGALILLFTLAPPLLSLDVFSYIAYARLGVQEGLNPYDFAPAAIPADEAAMRVRAFRDAVSVYGPLFTLLSYPLGALGVPVALWSLKVLAALSVAGIAALTARLATMRGVEPRAAAAFVALNPLVLVHVVGGGHNDAVMALLVVGAVALVGGSRPLAGGAAIVAGMALKAAGALIAPFAVVGARRPERGRLLGGIALAALVTAAAALAAFGSSALEALSVAGNNQSTVSRWSVPGTLSRISGIDVDLLRFVVGAAYAVAVLALLRWVALGADWVRAAGWATFGLLLASAYMTPWYLIWLLPLAAISRDRALLAATAAFTIFQTINAVPV
ncbi:MAG: glycosyltransferase 87 family protein [Actinomycetota bacterium]|nr:glycosyltransferase 87 family protein [Actinomycetota bacterium]